MNFIKKTWKKLLKMNSQGKIEGLCIPGEPCLLWKTPSEEMPERLAKIEVITIWNETSTGNLQADDNWHVKGHEYDLYNNQIIKWRYL